MTTPNDIPDFDENDVNTNDISIDCESLATDYDAPIIAIGAQAFDRTTGKLGQTFYCEVSIESAIKHSRVSASTLSWWLNQSARARQIFSNPDSEKKALSTALFEFMQWVRTTGKGVPRVWAKGPQEDITWLRHALHVSSVGVSEAWFYSNVRDVRTILELAEELTDFTSMSMLEDQPTVAHNAQDDATYQAKVISRCYAALRRSGAPAKPKNDSAVKAAPKAKGKAVAKVDDDDEI